MPVGKADLHIHTRVSDGFATVEQLLEYVEERTDLDVVAVTDHEDAAGGLRARELAARRGYSFEVVVGAELTTRQGHLLALFIESTPKSFRSVEATLEAIHAQGGLAVVPHPMSWLTRSIGRRTLEAVMAVSEAGVVFDGIELCNPSPAGRQRVAETAAMNARFGLAATGGSDAHHLVQTGTAWTGFEGRTAGDLRRAIEAKATTAAMGSAPSIREIGFGRTALGLAWGYAATPRKMLRAAASRRSPR